MFYRRFPIHTKLLLLLLVVKADQAVEVTDKQARITDSLNGHRTKNANRTWQKNDLLGFFFENIYKRKKSKMFFFWVRVWCTRVVCQVPYTSLIETFLFYLKFNLI
jgi:hypothetical protein